MRHLRSFNENSVPVEGGQSKEYRVRNLPHKGEPIEGDSKISIFQQDWFEKLLPDTIKIVSFPKINKLNFDQSLTPVEKKEFIFDKNDCSINNDLVQFTYYYNSMEKTDGDVSDGEPSLLEFDIHFVKNVDGIKLLVDITYGNNMAVEFSIESPNKINIIHYTGVGSKYDTSTHWGFKDETIKDLIKFFNSFTHEISLGPKDLTFIDEHFDSYNYDVDNKNHLYTDDSNLIKFGNSPKNETIKKFSSF